MNEKVINSQNKGLKFCCVFLRLLDISKSDERLDYSGTL